MNEIIYIYIIFYIRSEREYWCKLWVYWGTFRRDPGFRPRERERGKQTLYIQKQTFGDGGRGRVAIERVFFFENNNTTRVETKTTLINTSLLRSRRNKSLMTSVFFVCSRWVIDENDTLWRYNLLYIPLSLMKS